MKAWWKSYVEGFRCGHCSHTHGAELMPLFVVLCWAAAGIMIWRTW